MALTPEMKAWAANAKKTIRSYQMNRHQAEYSQGWDNLDIPVGAITLIYKGDIVFSEGWGSANVENTKPNGPYTACQLRSSTK